MNYINNMIIDGLAFGIPLFIMAVGAIYSEKSGITNLAVEGFQGFGAFCGAVFATLLKLNTGLDDQVLLYLAIVMALFLTACFTLHQVPRGSDNQRCGYQYPRGGPDNIPDIADQRCSLRNGVQQVYAWSFLSLYCSGYQQDSDYRGDLQECLSF